MHTDKIIVVKKGEILHNLYLNSCRVSPLAINLQSDKILAVGKEHFAPLTLKLMHILSFGILALAKAEHLHETNDPVAWHEPNWVKFCNKFERSIFI